MARKQTRRSISVRGDTYWRFKEYCEKTGQTMSGVTEQLIRSHFAGTEVVPEPPKPPSDMEKSELIKFSIQREAEKRREKIREAVERKKQMEEEQAKAIAESGGIFTF